MTLEEYRYYSDITIRLFNYMNSRINTMNSRCTLYIDMWDNINNTYANIRYPNHIIVHVGSVIDSWDDNWSTSMNKKDFICTCLAWAISHELHHADQLISMLRYNSNDHYRNEVEEDVERASYDWVVDHAIELSSVGGFTVLLNGKNAYDISNSNRYKKASPREFYLQTILNTVIRDYDQFNSMKVFTNENIASDIILIFNEVDTVVIKSCNKYLEENIPLFSEIVFKWIGRYDVYNIYGEVSFSYMDNGRTAAIVRFTISENYIKPMIFKSI